MREPRPLMVDPAIKVEDCKHMEFGNPSSHVYGGTFLWVSCIYLLCRNYTFENKIKDAEIKIFLILTATLLILILLGFSRVYKGVHSYDQVLNGFI